MGQSAARRGPLRGTSRVRHFAISRKNCVEGALMNLYYLPLYILRSTSSFDFSRISCSSSAVRGVDGDAMISMVTLGNVISNCVKKN